MLHAFFGTLCCLFLTNLAIAHNTATDLQDAFRQVARSALPAVVSISTAQHVKDHPQIVFGDPFLDHYFNAMPHREPRTGLGSGVLVSSDGHILTNHHVIHRADRITVTLQDGRDFPATRLGSDQKTDLALLKIAATRLPTIPLGNSATIQSGDWAIAIGNPFGLAGTVTAGIISATGRAGVLDTHNYADFIQTDAAINPGNSGGALLSLDGKLIGINTAIFSQSGGHMGIGFAVPVNMAKRVMADLRQYGHVKRGQLGVVLQPLNDTLLQRFFPPQNKGAFILAVTPDSSAEKAGFRPNDIIISLNKAPVSDYLTLRAKVAELALDTLYTCTVWRNGKQKKLTFKLRSPKQQRSSQPRRSLNVR